jgi:rSAM/selenodomain-associated transferase 1
MARWPAPGRCKRRLAVQLGIERAAAVQSRLSAHTLRTARQARHFSPLELIVAVSGLAPRAAHRWGMGLGAERVVCQGRGGLGLRLQRQVVRALAEGAPAVVLIGSDLPELSAWDLIGAFQQLEEVPLVLGPARDGGYWLIGLGCHCPALFSGIPWGGDQVLGRTMAVAEREGLTLSLLAERADLDRPEDLRRWR